MSYVSNLLETKDFDLLVGEGKGEVGGCGLGEVVSERRQSLLGEGRRCDNYTSIYV